MSQGSHETEIKLAVDNREEGRRLLRAAGFRVAAFTPDRDALDVAACAPPPRLVLLLGAEGDGLADTTRAACDIQLRIAMAAGIDSLNVATAAGIALHRLRACGSG